MPVHSTGVCSPSACATLHKDVGSRSRASSDHKSEMSIQPGVKVTFWDLLIKNMVFRQNQRYAVQTSEELATKDPPLSGRSFTNITAGPTT